jgi:hypothetical protein
VSLQDAPLSLSTNQPINRLLSRINQSTVSVQREALKSRRKGYVSKEADRSNYLQSLNLKVGLDRRNIRCPGVFP